MRAADFKSIRFMIVGFKEFYCHHKYVRLQTFKSIRLVEVESNKHTDRGVKLKQTGLIKSFKNIDFIKFVCVNLRVTV